MFEAVVTLCLALQADTCRDHLVPGYEAPSEAQCLSALDARPPQLAAFDPLVLRSGPRCEPVAEALEFREIAPGAFVHQGAIAEPGRGNRGDVANIGIVIGAESVAVIDTGSARWMGEAIWRSIRARTDKPVSHVILTHMHPDHVLGARALADAGAAVVGHANLARALADRQANYLESLNRLVGPEIMLGTRIARIDIAIDDVAEIDLGQRRLQLRAWPPAHTGTDLTVLDLTTGTLFAGDLVFDQHTPALDGSLLGWRAVLADLRSMTLDRLVPGHGKPALDWPAGGADTARYLAVLETDTRAAIDAGARLGDAVQQIAQGEAGRWDLFEAYNVRNATVAFTELEWE